MTAIETILWPGLAKLAPGSKLGGILARKPGYHNSRDHLPADDYSVGQFAIDRQGPPDAGSAIDWTFPDAQAGDYRTIAYFSRLLLTAGKGGDRRTYGMREFFGNADSDSNVEGWDFTKRRASTSDRSHLWHIHISIHRKYINDPAAMRSILAILAGVPVAVPVPLKEIDMQQSERLIHDTGRPLRTVGDVLADLSNLRNFLLTPVGSDQLTRPEPGSPLALLVDLNAKVDALAAKLGDR